MPKPYTSKQMGFVLPGKHLSAQAVTLRKLLEARQWLSTVFVSSAVQSQLAAIPVQYMSASESQSMSGSEPDSEEVSGSGDESMEESGDSESEEEQALLEPKVLPARGTRGNRMNTLIADEDSADEDFWQQEFFAEEGKDEEYEKSSEGEDEADTDFSESVGLIPTVIYWLSIRWRMLWHLLCFLYAYLLLTLLQPSSSDL